MLIKINGVTLINLNMCHKVTIEEINEDGPQGKKYECNIVLYYDKHGARFGNFNSRIQAQEVLDEILEAYQEGKHYWEPDPRGKLNIKLGDKWYTDEAPLHAYAKAIQLLGLEEIENRQLIWKDKSVETDEGALIVSKDKDPKRRQMQSGEFYIQLFTHPTTMKKVLEKIASELGVDIKVTIYV